MMTVRALRGWALVHKWTSLVCTAFLLVICLTGLPILFDDEIDHWLTPRTYQVLPAGTSMANLDHLAGTARGMYPGQIITSVSVDDDEPQVFLSMAPSWAALKADPKVGHFIRFDSRTAQVLEQSKPPSEQHQTFMGVMFSLHMTLFAGLPGALFQGMMGLLFVAAIVSGVVLYGPFTKKLQFGTVRTRRSPRLKWLDLHNLLGVVTLAWTLVVGATGVMNELSTPLFAIWQRTDVRAMLEPWAGKPVPASSELGSIQGAFDTAKRALPGMVVTSIVFPGDEGGSPYHYLLWAHGNTPLTGRLFSPVLVDARSGQLTAVVRMPWYLRALEISRPLHFGDYGGLPLKILWALLDIVTIAVLGSGLYLWLSRRTSPIDLRLAELEPAVAGLAPAELQSAAE